MRLDVTLRLLRGHARLDEHRVDPERRCGATHVRLETLRILQRLERLLAVFPVQLRRGGGSGISLPTAAEIGVHRADRLGDGEMVVSAVVQTVTRKLGVDAAHLAAASGVCRRVAESLGRARGLRLLALVEHLGHGHLAAERFGELGGVAHVVYPVVAGGDGEAHAAAALHRAAALDIVQPGGEARVVVPEGPDVRMMRATIRPLVLATAARDVSIESVVGEGGGGGGGASKR
mmetsp:Transcript_15784/g.38337  ORF Transcript_15784/g.38337 Transcript_15784/m.38337 type:complete len:233 (+) Transcript_15784:5639-6337(+)